MTCQPSAAPWSRRIALALPFALALGATAPSAQAYGDLTDLEHCTSPYLLTFHTADVSQAGTDSNIDVTLKGSAPLYATTTIRINPYLSGNAFERNSTDQVVLCFDDQAYGYITEVTVTSDGAYSGSGWAFDYLQIDYPNRQNNVFRFDSNQWIEGGMSVARASDTDVSKWNWGWYKVVIRTSDESGGGTDSNIHLTLSGTKGSTERIRLNGLLRGNAFERSSTETLALWSGTDAGQVTQVKLENDGQYAGTDWHVATVEVTDKTGKATTFTYNRWVNSDTAVDELSSFVPLEAKPEGTQDYNFLTFKFKSNLTNPGEVAWSETLEYAVSDTIEMSTETGYSVGLSANAGWAAGDKGGAEASVGMTYDRFKNDNINKVKGVQTTGSETVERTVPAKSFMVAKCTWTVPYDMYRVSADGVDTRMRVLKGQPRCAESVEVYGGDGAKAMGFTTWHAAQVEFGAQWPEVARQLAAAGVTFLGQERSGTNANVELKNSGSQPVTVVMLPTADQRQFLSVIKPGESQTWGPLSESMPLLFLVDASSSGAYGTPVTGGSEVGSYVVESAPKQLFVVR